MSKKQELQSISCTTGTTLRMKMISPQRRKAFYGVILSRFGEESRWGGVALFCHIDQSEILRRTSG